MFLGTRKMQIGHQLKQLRQQAEKFVQLPKRIEERHFLRKLFPKIDLMDRWKESTFGKPDEIV